MEIDSLEKLYEVANQSGQNIRMKPGRYDLANYLTEARMEQIKAEYPRAEGRPPRWLLRFTGSHNQFDFTNVTLEIDTRLYRHIRSGYGRCILIEGNDLVFKGLTIRTVGPKDEGGATLISLFGNNITLEDIQVYVQGSRPYGYGDLLGKGGPNLTVLQKHSGIMIAGQNNTLRRCKVFSRAFGHCFYIQTQGRDTKNITLEDCYAEGTTRSTDDMLRETEGIAHDVGFRSVYQNRDGRFMITPGYIKSLTEDGFRTYGGVGNVTLKNCIAVNTRAGFEIGTHDASTTPSQLEGCIALGTERGYLLGSNVVTRNCRGNIVHGPLLYLRENTMNSDIELELVGGIPVKTVHAIATIAGKNHRIQIFSRESDPMIPALPIFLGFAMPAHGEMSSPILPASTEKIVLINQVPRLPVITADEATDLSIDSVSPVVSNSDFTHLGNARGQWPKGGIAQ